MSIKLLSILHSWVRCFVYLLPGPPIRNTVRPTTLLDAMLYTPLSHLLPVYCLPASHILCGDNFAFCHWFYFSAGGAVQIGLTLMAERFLLRQSKATGIYYSAGSIATFTCSCRLRLICPKEVLPILCGSIPPSLPSVFYWQLFILAYAAAKTRHHSLKENVAPGG